MTIATTAALARPSWPARAMRFTMVQIIVAVLLVALAPAITFSLAEAIAVKSDRVMWPELLSAAGVLLAYWAYVRFVEKRPATELGRRGFALEAVAGLAVGAAMVAAEIGVLAALGVYEAAGVSAWSMKIAAPFATMVFVGVLEEVLCRGIIFRLAEKALGTWAALLISMLLFGLAHIPGEGAGALAIGITAVAGGFFCAAYMLTRRLWFCIAIHVAWNYTLATIFSIAVSGRESKGLLLGKLSGPQWLTGGDYGLEASVLTLLSLSILGAWFFWRACKRGHFVARPRTAAIPS
ncbi:MAG TPA: type II CAAX endopeptidase family protein [Burkholderiaceae bacterium]